MPTTWIINHGPGASGAVGPSSGGGVTPGIVSAVTLSEPGPRTLQPDQSTHTILRATPSISGGTTQQNITLYYSQNGGSEWAWRNVFPFFEGATGSIDFEVLIPTVQDAGVSSDNYYVYVLAANIPGGPTVMPTASLPGGGVFSNALTVLLASPNSALALAYVVNVADVSATSDNIFMGLNSLGNPYAQVAVGVDTPGQDDPNTEYYIITVDWVNVFGAEGNPGGVNNPPGERAFDEIPNDGSSHTSSTLYINYPDPSSAYGFLRFKLYGINRNNTNILPFKAIDGSSTQITAWMGGTQNEFVLEVGSSTPVAFSLGALYYQWNPQNTTEIWIYVPVNANAPVGGNVAPEGGHLYVEAPDQSMISRFNVGSGIGSGGLTGPWAPYDAGQFPYSPGQPWIIKMQLPNVYPSEGIRVYVQPYVGAFDPPPTQANLLDATPSAVLVIQPFDVAKPGSGVEYAPLVNGITAKTGLVSTVIVDNPGSGITGVVTAQVTSRTGKGALLDNPPVSGGQLSAAPNILAGGSGYKDGDNVVFSCTATLNPTGHVGVELADDNTTGKLVTPIAVYVDLSTLIDATGVLPSDFAYEIWGVWDDDPNATAVQLTGEQTVNGLVPSGPDNIQVPHSIDLDTPASPQGIALYCVSARVLPGTYTVATDSAGNLQRNSVVFGVTPATHVTLGSVNGTIDARQHNPTTLSSGLKGGAGLKLQLSYGAALGDDGTGQAAVKFTSPLTLNANQLAVALSGDFVVSGGALTQNVIDLAKAVNFNTTNFTKSGGAFLVNQIGVNSLIAGNALFAGQATFGYFDGANYGGYLVLNSVGLTVYDKVSGPNSEVALNSTGVFMYKLGTSYSTQITASGVGLFGPTSNMQISSNGITILNTTSNASLLLSSTGITIYSVNGNTGSPYVNITSSSVSIVGGSFSSPFISGGSMSITSGTTTVSISGSNFIEVSDSSSFIFSQITNAGFATGVSGTTYGQLHTASSGGFGFASNGILTLKGSWVPVFGGVAVTIQLWPETINSAVAGTATLPSNPVGFFIININGNYFKVPYYF